MWQQDLTFYPPTLYGNGRNKHIHTVNPGQEVPTILFLWEESWPGSSARRGKERKDDTAWSLPGLTVCVSLVTYCAYQFSWAWCRDTERKQRAGSHCGGKRSDELQLQQVCGQNLMWYKERWNLFSRGNYLNGCTVSAVCSLAWTSDAPKW